MLPKSKPFSFLDEFLVLRELMSNYCHLPLQNIASGRPTKISATMTVVFLWVTPNSVICGTSYAPLLLLCDLQQIFVGLVRRITAASTSQQIYQKHKKLK